MSMNRSMPPSAIIPELPYPNVREATDWLCHVFGFKERLRIGDHRTQLTFGDGSLVVTKRTGEPVSFSIMVRVDQIDQHYELVKRSNATIIQAPQDFPYGERQYVVEDPGGHRWTFSQTMADIDPGSWGGVLFE